MFGAKASEGAGIIDATLAYHRDGARARGFTLVKYFHVARPGDPAAQALAAGDERLPRDRLPSSG